MYHGFVDGCMPDDRDRDEGGKFTKSRDPSDVFDAMDPLEPYTSGELADMMDWPRRTVYEALQTLSEDGKIRKKKPEPRRAIWIKTDESDESESSGEDRETNQDESEGSGQDQKTVF
jgi:hypothetical protein